MDPTSIITVSLIISAFLLFAAVLAYGDYATVQVRREKEAAAAKEPEADKPTLISTRKAA